MKRSEKLRVAKLGGSLLEHPGAIVRMTHWLVQQPPAVTVLVVGGGELAETIRRVDKLQGVGEETAHWLCIDAMEITAYLAVSFVPAATHTDCWGELLEAIGQAEAGVGPIVFGSKTWLREEEHSQPGTPLPHGWQVTSDSIAARLAEVLKADELVLFKSAEPPAADAASLAAAGYVDGYFPQAVGEREFRVVNLAAG